MRAAHGITALAIGLSLGFSSAAFADEKQPPPDAIDESPPPREVDRGTKDADQASNQALDEQAKRYPPSAVRWGLALGGSALTAGAYFATLAAALGWPEVPGSEMLQIPIVGPWIALARVDECSEDSPGCDSIRVLRGVLEVFSGLIQAGGLPLIGEAIFMTTEGPAKAAAPKKEAFFAPKAFVLPMITPTSAGIGIVGTF